ncbi:MAG TPA: MBL fold metallo-hydrolase [bacterium]|nr:MBL fold metallo-hydrolase [bacterium]
MTALRVTVLASGSAGNALLLECGADRVLVDAGLSLDTLERALDRRALAPRDVRGVVLTHEHDDHARGAGPLSRTTGVRVYATAATLAAAAQALAGADVHPVPPGVPFAVGPFEITAFPVPHDAAEPVGLAIAAAGRRVVVATDLGAADEVLDARLADADLAIIESNYDLGLLHVSGYPWFLKNRILGGRGHLSNDEAARALARTAGPARAAGRRRGVCLVHLSDTNNLAPLARDTVRAALDAAGLPAGAGTAPLVAVRPNGWTEPLLVDW